jgi:hypothetical protein
MITNHDVAYAQQNPEVRAKTDATCMAKYGLKRAFLLPEVFEKIRTTHRAKYGVDFPLQFERYPGKDRHGTLGQMGSVTTLSVGFLPPNR